MTTTPDTSAADRPEPDWYEPARHWLADQLARHGRRVTGPVEPRLRPWSTVWRVPTDGGAYWFKANSVDTAYEAGLVRALAGLVPGRVPDPLAVDAGRGWLLLPDGGETLRDVLQRQPDPARWERVLPAYVEVQLATTTRVDDLIGLGVPDHRPVVLPGLLARLLDDRDWLLVGTPDGLAPQAHDRLRRLLPEFAGWCRRLDDLGVPATVQHDDLHDGNVFAGGDGYRFFDWGDASVSHPFGTLLVTLRSVGYGLEPPADGPVLARLRDAYLEPWSDRYDRAVLRESLDLAFQVAKVTRSLSWRRALRATGPEGRREYGAAVPGWLGELLAPNPL